MLFSYKVKRICNIIKRVITFFLFYFKILFTNSLDRTGIVSTKRDPLSGMVVVFALKQIMKICADITVTLMITAMVTPLSPLTKNVWFTQFLPVQINARI